MSAFCLPGEKWCPRCRDARPTSAFGRNRTRPDGRAGWCKTCDAAAHRERGYEQTRTPRQRPSGWARARGAA